MLTPGNLALAHIAAQLPLIDVPVRKIDISVIGDKTQSTMVKEVMVGPVAQITVDHHDLSPALT